MDCPRTHEWYELERGRAPRDDAERLRRHGAECDGCRQAGDELRTVAAALELLAPATRADLSAQGEESLRRRARVHGLLGKPLKAPRVVRFPRRVLPLAAAAVAAAIFIAIAFQWVAILDGDRPDGALGRLMGRMDEVAAAEDLLGLSPLARAAVSEELATAEPAADRLNDLLLVAYITGRPREDRQVDDVRFLLEGVHERREAVASRHAGWMPPLAWAVPLAVAAPATDGPPARAAILRGDYRAALERLPTDGSAAVERAWCLEMLGRSDEAAVALAGSLDADAMARGVSAHLALEADKVVEALAEFETMARQDDRYWFAAGYVCRYERADMRGAGARFSRVGDRRIAAYVAEEFATELALAQSDLRRVVLEDFEGYDLGEPKDWVLVETRGEQFRVVPVPDGKALQLDQMGRSGAEVLTGSPFGADYTLSFDFVIVDHEGGYALAAAAYRREDHTGYALELSPNRLRLVKQFASSTRVGTGTYARPERLLVAPLEAAASLREPFEKGTWHTMKLRVQRTERGVGLAGKVWPRAKVEPPGWQVVWTDAGQAGDPLAGGLAGLQASRARVVVDNLTIARNVTSDTPVPTQR